MVVVVVVIVFNCTSPKFHKLVFSDYRQLSASKGNYKYIYFSISCSRVLILDTYLHSQTKTPTKHLNANAEYERFRGFSTIEKEYEFCSTFRRMIFPWVKATLPPTKSHIEKNSCRSCQELVSYLAYKQRIRISGVMHLLYITP